MRHLSRLPREYYQAFAVVHWTISFELRATGWLDAAFHANFRELLLHAASRESLFCPIYVLMPDHIHLMWMGLKFASDQHNAMRFLRQFLQSGLARLDAPGRPPYELQKQSHDSVLREEARRHDALAATCVYILSNPVRAQLVEHPLDWPWLGAIVPGYPDLHPVDAEFWPRFWKLYAEQREPGDAPKLPPF